jgi:ferric-dicitrate binding protein FerR (iron transport regulator)
MARKEYSVEDLVSDETFADWVFGRNSRHEATWERWTEEHPEQGATVAEAIVVLRGLTFKPEPGLSPEALQADWQSFKAGLADQRPAPARVPDERLAVRLNAGTRLVRRYRWAAVWLGLLLLSGLVYFLRQPARETVARTAYGESKTLRLPDGSTVTLNGNSQVRYKAHWGSTEDRDVWLSGEAFFSVIHTRTHQPFIVHPSGELQVEVLGTEFNVSERGPKTAVVLVSGKVRVTEGNETLVEMAPNEMVEFTKDVAGYRKTKVEAAAYTAWREGRLVFNNTPLREVVDVLTHTYGLQVHLADRRLLEQKVSGSIPSEKANDILQALEELFNLAVSRQGKQIWLKSRNHTIQD